MLKKFSIKVEDIRLIVYDFDGVMTDNKVFIFPDGKEAVVCNRSDGLAVGMIKTRGIRQMIISSEVNKITRVRAKKIGLLCLSAVKDKKKCLADYCRKNKLRLDKVMFIGDDLNDLEAMKSVGWPACPIDAHWRIKKEARVVFTKKGGEGVIRELADRLLYD